jgi:hypothetical protein
MSTLSELQAEVVSHQFSASQYNPYIVTQVNDAQNYITAQTDFRELQDLEEVTTVAGTATYALPTDFQRLVNVTLELSTGTILPLVSDANTRMDLEEITTGQPERFAIDGMNLRLWPTPSEEYTVRLRYYRIPTTLVNAGDISEIPAQYHHLLVSYALFHCYQRENDYQAAQYHKQRFDEDIMKCRGEVQYDTNDRTEPKFIGDHTAWVP